MKLAAIKPLQILSVAAMTTGPERICAIDRLSKCAEMVGWDGAIRCAIAAGALTEPGTIAVRRGNIVFISDDFDNTIRIYRGLRAKANNSVLAGKIGCSQTGTVSFNCIGGLAVTVGQPYATDSLNSRVQIMLVGPRVPDVRNI